MNEQPPHGWPFLFGGKVTKEEVVAAIQACAEKLKRAPTLPELMKHKGISVREVRKHFGNFRRAIEECGLEKSGRGWKVELRDLFEDWAGVARKLKKLPTIWEYQEHGRYSFRPLKTRFGSWALVAEGMKMYAEDHGLAEEWHDVMELVRTRLTNQRARAEMFTRESQVNNLSARPVYGPLIRAGALVYGPTNELGVVCLFCSLAEELGFLILQVRAGYPDCEAMRVVEENRLKPVLVEFEFKSRNFLMHKHDPAACDLIVCWENNWPEAPLEVLELKSAVERLAASHAKCPQCRRLRVKPSREEK